jgi:Transcriptional regulators
LCDSENLVGKWISPLYRYRKAFMAKKLENYGAAGGLFMILLTISFNDGINQEQISDYLKIDKATTAKAVKRLECEQYVRREIDADDKRINRVYITETAVEAVAEIKKALAEWDGIIREGIPDEDYQKTQETLHKMLRNAYYNSASHNKPADTDSTAEAAKS